jgi:GMP synthase-like glutamine amidotransferase
MSTTGSTPSDGSTAGSASGPGSGSGRLRIGLLQCGHLVGDLGATHGDYPILFRRLLSEFGVDLEVVDATTGGDLGAVDRFDGWLVSGSAASVYDDLPWIDPAAAFLREVVRADVAVVGVCFGHQLLATALGGRVEKADAGWGVGVHEYDVAGAWAVPVAGDDVDPDAEQGEHPEHLALIASHQDQVVVLPDDAEVVAHTNHCPVGAFTVGPRVLGVQPHPEFTTGLSRDLTERRRDKIGPARADAALESLHRPVADAATWVARRMTATWRSNGR